MGRVRTDAIDVMCVIAADGPAGGQAAFALLESALPGLRGRKFYGTFMSGEYRACVSRVPGDEPTALGLAAWRIPGGMYERLRVVDWAERVDDLGKMFEDMVAESNRDDSRPSIEFYRSSREIVLFRPVKETTDD